MSEKTNPKQEVFKIKDLLGKEFNIPNYQRPYKWKEENVIQLLEDIFEHTVAQKKEYRIGSVIVHNKTDNEKDTKLDIVDGQQRLTTLTLVMKCLGEEQLLSNETYGKESFDNIKKNYQTIEGWIKAKISEKCEFLKKIKESCEVVLFTVYDLDEAFQLFDSQNSRGKSLEPYDLLKAFHLREMEGEPAEEINNCVAKWEKTVDEHKLSIIHDHLFRIRKWARHEYKYHFTKSDIAEFKGLTFKNKQQYPYETALRILDGFVGNAQQDKYLKNMGLAQDYPFSITMPIINGKRFFEYVFHYVELEDKLFSYDSFRNTVAQKEFVDFYETYCLGIKELANNSKYQGAGRSGDIRVCNLYENLLLLFVDKFGEMEFKDFYKPLFKESYQIRCQHSRISDETILKSEAATKLLPAIANAFQTSSLNSYKFKNYVNKSQNQPVQGIETILKEIYGQEQSTTK